MTKRGIAPYGWVFMTSYLTERREKVLEMTLKGHSKNYIATVLGVAPRTITNDRKAIRTALRPHIDINALQEVLLQVLREFESNWHKINKIYYDSPNVCLKLHALRMQDAQMRRQVGILRTLGFIATESEKSFLKQKKR